MPSLAAGTASPAALGYHRLALEAKGQVIGGCRSAPLIWPFCLSLSFQIRLRKHVVPAIVGSFRGRRAAVVVMALTVEVTSARRADQEDGWRRPRRGWPRLEGTDSTAVPTDDTGRPHVWQVAEWLERKYRPGTGAGAAGGLAGRTLRTRRDGSVASDITDVAERVVDVADTYSLDDL